MDEIVLSFKDEDAANEFDYYFRDAWGSECDTEVKGTKVTIIPTGFFDVDELKKLLRTEWNTAEWPFTFDNDCCESCDAAKETKAQRAMRVAETENGRKFRSKRIENKKKKAPKHKFSYAELEESIEACSDFESQVWLELCDMCQEEGLPCVQIFSKYGYLIDETDEEGISDPQEVAYSMLKTWEADCAEADGFEDGRYPSFSEMNDTVYESANDYIVERKNKIDDTVNDIINYYEKHIGIDKLDKNYVQRNWSIWCGYIPDADERKAIKVELLKRGYEVDSFFYTNNVNHLSISRKMDNKKLDAAKTIDVLMNKSGIKDLNELKRYLQFVHDTRK